MICIMMFDDDEHHLQVFMEEEPTILRVTTVRTINNKNWYYSYDDL